MDVAEATAERSRLDADVLLEQLGAHGQWEAVPEAALDDAVDRLAGRLRGVPKNQLMMTKTVVNQAYDNMGLNTTQMFATLFDGVSRHSPEGIWFRERAQEVGFKQAVAERDSGDPIASQVSKRMPKED